MRISDWSSDVCSSDLIRTPGPNPAMKSSPTGTSAETANKIIAIEGGMMAPSSAADACSAAAKGRSEERRVGKECGSTCRSRWSPYHEKKKKKEQQRVQT